MEDGLYYRDDFNDSPWSCRAGTSDEDGIWMNTSDQAGTIMACLVWLLLGTCSVCSVTVCVVCVHVCFPPFLIITILSSLIILVYSALTVTFLAATGGIPSMLSNAYCVLCALALASHAKTTLTDPGAVPVSAVPTELQRRNEKLSMCSQCQTFKPPFSHHCRICNRYVIWNVMVFVNGSVSTIISSHTNTLSWFRCISRMDRTLLLMQSLAL